MQRNLVPPQPDPAGSPFTDIVPGPDDPALTTLFCGVNPGRTTVTTGLYFSTPGNRFWRVLHGAGFTPRLFAAADHVALPSLGLGITSLVPRPTARADELTPAELRAGVVRLAATVDRLRPRWVGFLGITAFRVAFGQPRAEFGPQPCTFGETRVWVLPNPSGLNRAWTLPRLVDEYGRFREQAR